MPNRLSFESEERLRLLIEGVREYAIFQLESTGPHRQLERGRRAPERLPRERSPRKHFSVFYEPKTYRVGAGNQPGGGSAKGGVRRRGLANPQGRFPFLGSVVIAALRDPDRNLRDSSTHTGSDRASRERVVLKQAKEELELRVDRRQPSLRK